jgi:creatinine amidohydrolase/Fe(II)-dependent formamide hydrolase-like protein/7-cyano-7-deazaguanine synthase in queuosine biosynthesis
VLDDNQKDSRIDSAESSQEQPNPMDRLVVFDRLEVGPVRLEPDRLVAPYRLFFDDKESVTDLIYKYEENVFDPDSPVSQNLAAMLACQVALNYGLFCRSLVFHGIFDENDRQFIRDMTENTAREVYVKKFLEPNPFLTGDAAEMPVCRPDRYSRAAIRFSADSSGRLKWRLWTTERGRHAVLSSGGKDSLLSYGLLKEIGQEVHPIFVNESGRHWFTALNAYRHFKYNVPNTARVWVNSDRLFNWMLKHMPFIRQDYASIRSDEYPIRLWTVAVFLFGILPLVRKRGIGRILIGDEYDTTVPARTRGITHYDGLYDQSIFFDQALSRYYMRKGWSINQFSVLRPLSEMLIEKILAQRYPHLLRLQTSCHAAHKEQDTIHPCGRCEKCRRIVGMLTALDADPRSCGYTDRQIADCLSRLASMRVSQEEAGREQLLFMLQQKQLIELSAVQSEAAKAHPEILMCRFDGGRSPFTATPVDLRRPMFQIFLKHCNGAVTERKSGWEPIDLLNTSEVENAYPFELDFCDVRSDNAKPASSQKAQWGTLTWQEAETRLGKIDIALLPVGAIEQHGPHLPLDTDAFDAEYLARRVALACSQPLPLVLPLIPYGVSYHHEDFTGTISISTQTLARFVYEVGMSAARSGVRKLVIINGHGGNHAGLNHAAQMINRDAKIFVCVDSGESSDVDIYQITETPNDVHAGEIETSTSLAIRPQLVRMDLAERSVPQFSSRYLDFTGKRGIAWHAYTQKISANGVLGDPTRASAKKGRKIWEIMFAHLVALVEDLKTMSLEEIYQKDY